MLVSTILRRIAEVPDSSYKQEIIDKINRYYKPFKTKRMKKLIILFIAALLPVVATAADTGSGSPPLTKKEQRRTLRGYKAAPSAATRASWNSAWESPIIILVT